MQETQISFAPRLDTLRKLKGGLQHLVIWKTRSSATAMVRSHEKCRSLPAIDSATSTDMPPSFLRHQESTPHKGLFTITKSTVSREPIDDHITLDTTRFLIEKVSSVCCVRQSIHWLFSIVPSLLQRPLNRQWPPWGLQSWNKKQ